MAKAKKQRAENYEKPLKIEGAFGDVIKVAMTNPDKPTQPVKKAAKKKAKG